MTEVTIKLHTYSYIWIVKQWVSYIMIVLGVALLSVVSTRNAVIYWSFTINQDYIAAHLCEQKDDANNSCQGHCYLEKQLQDQSDASQPLERPELEVKYDWITSTAVACAFGECHHTFKPTSLPLKEEVRTPQLTDVFHPPRI